MVCKSPLDDRIIVFGMSCSGKTTFARQLIGHHYYCFDAMFHWHIIETLGLSSEVNLRHIAQQCIQPKYVLDGWHLSDKVGQFLPEGASVYVVYAPYDQIIRQYRVEVDHFDQHIQMFDKWYKQINYAGLPNVRYFLNCGDFVETSAQDFFILLQANNQGTEL